MVSTERSVSPSGSPVQERNQRLSIWTQARVVFDWVASFALNEDVDIYDGADGERAIVHQRAGAPGNAHYREIPGIGPKLVKNDEIIHAYGSSGGIIFRGSADTLPNVDPHPSQKRR